MTLRFLPVCRLYSAAISWAKIVVQIDGGDGDVAVLVAGDSFEVALRQEFGESFGDDDHAVLFPFLFAGEHGRDDAWNDLVQIHDGAGLFFACLGVDRFLFLAVASRQCPRR